MKRKLAILIDHRMPCVISSMKTHCVICLLRKQINYFSFSFIAHTNGVGENVGLASATERIVSHSENGRVE